MSTTRQEVYAAIDTERDHQLALWGTAGASHSNLEYLAYIQDYVTEAMHRLSRQSDASAVAATQGSLRKIAGLAVAALEANGCRKRTP